MPTFPITKRRNDALVGTRLDPTDPLNEGLVGLWDFDYGNDAQVFDQSVYNRPANWVGTTSERYGIGPRGSGRSGIFIEANSDRLNTSTPAVLTSFTYSVWMKKDFDGETENLMQSSGVDDRFISLNNNKLMYKKGSSITGSIPITAAAGWVLATFTYDGTIGKLYVNNKFDTSGAISAGRDGDFIFIGNDLTGQLATARVYYRDLSHAEIAKLFLIGPYGYRKDRVSTSFISTKVPTRITFPITKRRNDALAGTRLDPTDPLNQGLVGLWDFNYGDDVNVFDQSAYSNHGKWSGSSEERYAPGPPNLGKRVGYFVQANSDYVDCGDTPTTDVGTGPFTLCGWVKLKSGAATEDYGFLGGKGSAFRYHIWSYRLTTGRPQLDFDDDSIKKIVDATTNIDDGLWHHIAPCRYNPVMMIDPWLKRKR